MASFARTAFSTWFHLRVIFIPWLANFWLNPPSGAYNSVGGRTPRLKKGLRLEPSVNACLGFPLPGLPSFPFPGRSLGSLNYLPNLASLPFARFGRCGPIRIPPVMSSALGSSGMASSAMPSPSEMPAGCLCFDSWVLNRQCAHLPKGKGNQHGMDTQALI